MSGRNPKPVRPPRKYYRLTDTGQHALGELQGYWQHLTETLNRIGK
jgi:DNA-binding PadR family transcriptional regulator